MSFSPVLAGYRGAVAALGPFAGLWLDRRARAGKEDAARLSERYGYAARPRPDGALIWLHGASVGESGVALQLVEALAARNSGLNFLLTSGTRTSADLIARRAPPQAVHVYAPIDRADAVRRFMSHWRPDLGVFVESEMWPNLILEAQAARVPLALVNARISPASLGRLARWPAAARQLLDAFALLLAADRRTADALSRLSGRTAPLVGNLKLAAPAPPVNAAAHAELAAQIGARPVWLAASTHPGEDEILLAAQHCVRESVPNALLIIAPRHPERGAAIAASAGGAPRRALRQEIGAADVYVADTLGELGVFYSLANVTFIAGSLLPEYKGHNPAEPARLGSAIVTGPYVESFQDVFDAFAAADAALYAANPNEIAAAITSLWRDDAERARLTEAARAIAESGADALKQTVSQLVALAPAPKIGPADARA